MTARRISQTSAVQSRAPRFARVEAAGSVRRFVVVGDQSLVRAMLADFVAVLCLLALANPINRVSIAGFGGDQDVTNVLSYDPAAEKTNNRFLADSLCGLNQFFCRF